MSARKPILDRNYDFTDAMLEQLADYTASNITRDMATLASRGITPATVTHLNTLQEALSDSPTDIEARALVTEAVEVKDAACAAALIEARRLRTAAQNVFGEDSAKYRRFRFEGMDKLREDTLPRALRAMQRVGVELQAQLAPEGINAAFLTAFSGAVMAFDDKLEDVIIAEQQRDRFTEERIENGNILYKEIVRICNIGKDVFAPIREAIYNDYVIENYVGSSVFPASALLIRGTVTINGTSTPIANAEVKLGSVEEPDTEFTVTNEKGKYEFRFTDLPIHLQGRARINIDAPGFQQFTHEFDVETGEIFTINVALMQGLQMAA